MTHPSEYALLRKLCADVVADKGPNLTDLAEWLAAHPEAPALPAGPSSAGRIEIPDETPTLRNAPPARVADVTLHDVRTERLWRVTLADAPLVPFKHEGDLQPTGANVTEVTHSVDGTRHEVLLTAPRPSDLGVMTSRWVTTLPERPDGRIPPDGLITDLPGGLVRSLQDATGAVLVPHLDAPAWTDGAPQAVFKSRP